MPGGSQNLVGPLESGQEVLETSRDGSDRVRRFLKCRKS